MYTMGLSIHSISTLLLLVFFVLNIFILKFATTIQKYKRLNSIVLLPLSIVFLGTPIFTGVIMMAAKHLDFTVENIVMIFISLLLIILEAKRHKTLKYINIKKENILNTYQVYAFKILYAEFLLSLSIGVWMWLK